MAASGADGRWSFADLSVTVKILAGIGVAVMVAAIVGVVGLCAMSTAGASAGKMYASNVASIQAIGQLEATARQAHLDVSHQAISQDAATIANYADSFTADLAAFDVAVTTYQASMPVSDPAMVADLQSQWRAWVELVQVKLMALVAVNDMARWQEVRDAEAAPLMNKIDETLEALSAAESADAERSAAAARSGYESSRLTWMLVLVLVLVFALVVGCLLAVARGIGSR
ncbi:hypothetical protein ADL15_47460 [Actinoplanes awajinensis subsp. mycoplanecinus]|uniref:Chemotaxis methyl-accepting receptor HlyB-like 4HB MCP domain-containing protein n=1 Tax=Actinoplanes awajinensis subsp. mycoplanecinus TaxID=135947 RepID=A0A101J9S2_9ACTN|nr:hypothetical protein ADL15_47460 [Actinoplanes awajinensis subsp. mycoplanecinus]